MHKRLLVVCLTCFAIGLMAVATRAAGTEETVSLDQVPAAVRAVIETHAEGGKVREVEVVSEKGIKVFEIEIEKGGKTTEFSVSSDGKYLGVEAEEDEDEAESANKEAKSSTKLPDAVTKTFKKTFPKAKISKLDVDQENGVTVYDIEFKDGGIEKETDIAADGTMLEFTIVVDAKAVPEAAMQAVRQVAKGAKIGRIEQVEISYETKDGKAVKLPQPVTHYEVEMAKGNRRAEIVVVADGTVVEPAKWGNDNRDAQARGGNGRERRWRRQR